MEGFISKRTAMVVVRALVLLLVATSFTVAVPRNSEARVCPDGRISVNGAPCRMQDCSLDLENGTVCYPEPPVNPPQTCDERYAYLSPSLTIKGTVLGPGGAALTQACIYWVDSQGRKSSVLTDHSGSFSINVPANVDNAATNPIELKDFMTWDSEVIVPTEWVDPARRAEMVLAYTQSIILSPREFNSSADREITVKVISAAPADTRVLAEPLTGSVLTLTKDDSYTGPAPLSRWTATFTVSVGTTEGVRTFPTCILSGAGNGSCDNPGTDVVYAPIPPAGFKGLFVVDNTAPYLGSVAPKNLHNTTDTTPIISVTPADSLSGPDIKRTQIFVDGSPLGSGYWMEPATPLSLGVHSVTATIWDLAGNSSVIGWRFAVTALESGPAMLTVAPKTVTVAPQGLPGFCCQYVTFSNVQTKLGEANLTLRGSPLWSGVGSVSRYVSHEALRVTFKSAAQEMTVPATSYSMYSYDIAVLEPSPDDLVVGVPEKGSAIDVGVYVPQGFLVTNETTATVWAVAESLPQTDQIFPYYENSDPTPYVMPECSTWKCQVTGVVTCGISSTTYSCNGTYPRVTLEREKPGGLDIPRAVLGKFGQLNEGDPRLQDSTTRNDYPVPNPAKSQWVAGVERYPNCGGDDGFRCANLLGSDSNANLTAFWATGDLFRAYGHEYFFKVSNTATPTTVSDLLAWQVSDVTPGQSCSPAGGCRETRLVDFGNGVESGAGWEVGSTAFTQGTTLTVWPGATQTVGPIERRMAPGDSSSAPVYRLGAKDDPTRLVNLVVPGGSNADELEGWFESGLSAISRDGSRKAAVGQYNLWHPAKDMRVSPPIDYSSSPAEVFTGTAFVATTQTSSIFLNTSLYFKFRIVEVS